MYFRWELKFETFNATLFGCPGVQVLDPTRVCSRTRQFTLTVPLSMLPGEEMGTGEKMLPRRGVGGGGGGNTEGISCGNKGYFGPT